MKVVDFSSQSEIIISGDWRDWLVAQGYARPPVEENPLTLMAIEGSSAWAVYHPPVGCLPDVEMLTVGIPTIEQAQDWIEICVELIKGPLAMLSGIEVSGVMETRIPASREKPKGFGKRTQTLMQKRKFCL